MIDFSGYIKGTNLREILKNPDILYEKMGYNPNEWVIMPFSWRKDKESCEIYTGDLIRDLSSYKEYEVKIIDGRFKAVSVDTEIILDSLPEIRVIGSIIQNVGLVA